MQKKFDRVCVQIDALKDNKAAYTQSLNVKQLDKLIQERDAQKDAIDKLVTSVSEKRGESNNLFENKQVEI